MAAAGNDTPPATRPPATGLERWGGPVLTLLVLLGVGTLVVLARRAAAADPRYRVDPGRVAVQRSPAWLDAGTAERVATRLAGALEAGSLLRPGALSSWAADVLDASPWVAAVEPVEPVFPGRARLSVRLRRPVLSLPGDDLVATDGVHLGPGRVAGGPAPLRFLGPGDNLDKVECAAAAAEILPWRETLADAGVPIDRVRTDPAGRVVFLTTEGVELEWGRSTRASRFAAVDLPPEARVRHLLDALERRTGLIGVVRVVLWKDRVELVLR